MPPRNDPVDDFMRALSDKKVQDLIGEIIEKRLRLALQEIESLRQENVKHAEQISSLSVNLAVAKQKIEHLEAYTRRDNLVISGLPLVSSAEAVSTVISESSSGRQHAENVAVTEKAVIEFCQSKLNLHIQPTDISIAHRLKKTTKTGNGPPPIIVRFTNRKMRDSVYAARLLLKKRENPAGGQPIFINEDLTQERAALFAKARKLVKDNKLFATWSRNGDIFIRETNAPNCRPVCVMSVAELPISD